MPVPSPTPEGPRPAIADDVDGFDARLGAPGFEWQGRILAVFGSAAVATRAQGEGGGQAAPETPRFVTLLDPGRPLLPWSLRLTGGVGLLGPGAALRLGGRILWMEASGSVWGAHQCTLRGSGRCLSLWPQGWDREPSRRELAARLGLCPMPERTQALLGRRIPEGSRVERLATTSACSGLARLSDAMWSGHPEIATRVAAERLSGLGPGSTPTGDDLLVGVAAAAWALRGSGLLPSGSREALLQALDMLPDSSTTPAAREMLREAARGFFAEPLVELLRAFTRTDRPGPTIEAATAELLTLGRHSGADLLAGALALLERVAESASTVAKEATPHDRTTARQ